MKSKLIQDHAESGKQVFNKQLGVFFNGEDNLYPLLIENLINASPTATQCAWLYESFMSGGGFVQDFTEIDLDEDTYRTYSPDDLLFDITESLSRQQGVFVHINYNALYQKESFNVIPFDLCRLGKMDDKDYSGKIVKSNEGWGRDLRKTNLQIFDVYNPRPEVIQAQVEAAGGWEKYKGQILYFTFQQKSIYPKSLLDSVYLFADTEYQIGLFFNSTTKRGFNDAKLIRHHKFPDAQSELEFEKNLRGLMGMENASSIMTVEDDWDSDNQQGKIKVETFVSDVKAEKYLHFEEASANYIRKAFKNIPPQLVDYVTGKLGNTSGEDLVKAQSVYNSLIARDRLKIERLFRILFENYKTDFNTSKDWTIKQYSLLQDGTINQ